MIIFFSKLGSNAFSYLGRNINGLPSTLGVCFPSSF